MGPVSVNKEHIYSTSGMVGLVYILPPFFPNFLLELFNRMIINPLLPFPP